MPQGEYLQYGGQAIVEGVMMRSPRHFAVACRAPNDEIVLRCEPLEKTWIGRQSWLKKPFLRGSLALFDAMALGIRAMRFAANIQLDPAYLKADEAEEGKQVKVPSKAARLGGLLLSLVGVLASLTFLLAHVVSPASTSVRLLGFSKIPEWVDAIFWLILFIYSLSELVTGARRVGLTEQEWIEATNPKFDPNAKGTNGIQDIAIGATFVFSIFFGLGLFVYLPNLLAQTLQARGWDGMQINALAGLIKIAIFFGYLTLIGQHPGIIEVFKYHGAEHKAINALEADEDLTVANCMRQTRLHPRCGTSFAIIVLILSVIVFTFIPRYPFGDNGILLNATVRLGMEIIVLPLVSGAAYEVIRIAGKFKNNNAVRWLLWPGLMSQYITTREPEEKHVVVALRSLQAVVDAEKDEVAPPTEAQLDESAAEIA